MKRLMTKIVLNVAAMWMIVSGHYQELNHKTMMADREIGNIGDFRD